MQYVIYKVPSYGMYSSPVPVMEAGVKLKGTQQGSVRHHLSAEAARHLMVKPWVSHISGKIPVSTHPAHFLVGLGKGLDICLEEKQNKTR